MSSSVATDPHHAPTVNLTKFGMITFLASEVMLFAGLITAYVILWFTKGSAFEPVWLKNDSFKWPLLVTSINTIFLFSSSGTLYMAEKAVVKAKSYTLWLLATTILGAIFVSVQYHEWKELYGEHIWNGDLGGYSNVWMGSGGSYTSCFFAITGFHGLHVTIGVIFLAVTTLMAAAGRFTPHRHDFLTCVSLYWHFVDVVWVLVFTIFYLLPRFI